MKNNINNVVLALSVSLCCISPQVFAKTSEAIAPDLVLAKVYKKRSDISRYWVSEKLDGVRAYWNGEQFISRQGNVFHAPAWFTEGLPTQPLDGELWIARDSFEQLLSTVSKNDPVDEEWQKVSYRIFELPDASGTFSQRIQQMKALIDEVSSPRLKLVEQYRVPSHKALMARLDEVVSAGAEGLMLHHESAPYRTGRSSDLLKVKRFDDAEARVIKHLPGKGKYAGMMGALLLETPDGIRFRIGSGFSDEERRSPPEIGASVTYKYYGKTKKGKPRFASFLRVRQSVLEQAKLQ
ncbi:DNA ligase [Leucothrix pacifica]|uniref:DNA ligase n=1 Tax=Leucothrix pacifica TaxID=1247513 RepID=A0A317CNW8_9GAMM|nr:DNA ligase [Leucothrix pacifica]PWQ99841.1 DNA ligase [Leucothrix pacifica]